MLNALVTVIREDLPSEPDDRIQIVVEGDTDAMYLETAARLAIVKWGDDLLLDCRIVASGAGRGGGAQRAVGRLLALEENGIPAIGLFDADVDGIRAKKDVERLTSQRVYRLPEELAPWPNSEIEIEDLLPVSLIESFYEGRPELEPEEKIIRGTLTRIVVDGADKEDLANWVCQRVSFQEMERFVYVFFMLRQSIGLRLPHACPPLNDWLRDLIDG